MGCFDFVAMFVCGAEGSFYEDEEILSTSVKLSENSRSHVEKSMSLRSVFLSVEPVEMAPVKGHTHGVSAASRSTASSMIDQLGQLSGQKPVFFQGSAADVRKGRAVTRTWHWAKDQNVLPCTTAKAENQLLAMVDVDEHIDMPKFLMRNFVPVVIYTFQPGSVCRDNGEYKYTFLEDNSVLYEVSGGGSYKHQVWNYAGDCIGITHKFLGFTTAYATYSVERKVLDPDHQLILLSPLRKYGWRNARTAARQLAAAELERLTVAHGKFTRLKVNHSKSMQVHTGTVGGYLKSVTAASVDEAIASAMRTSKVRITVSTVKSKMIYGSPDDKDRAIEGAEVLLEYHLAGCGKPATICSLDVCVRNYQWLGRPQDLDEDAKPSMVAFMKPIVDAAFVPENTKNNDQRMVNKRVKELANTVTLTPFLEKTMAEFVDLFCEGWQHCIVPLEVEAVYEKQKKPSQQHILHASEHEIAIRKASMFMKREAYQKLADPRGITTINGVDKRDYSCYTYAVAEVIKNFEWYAFGKTPREIAERVTAVCSEASYYVDATDFSRMDGRVSNIARMLESSLMLRLFAPMFHVELGELLRSQHSLNGRTRNGVSYETGLSRLSGSPETSLFNTILSAFTAYLSMRMTMTEGSFMGPREAWNGLGVYGGDDGLTADVARDTQMRAARMVGQVLTLDRTKRYHVGVSFLSRQYGPDVWTGNCSSCCDVKRTLSKFHVTVCLPRNIKPPMKLREKAYALSLTDANTPVVGLFVKRALALTPVRRYSNILGIWNSELDVSEQYPNEEDEWMMDLFKAQLPTFDHEAFAQWLEAADAETILSPPVLCERPEVVEPTDGFIATDGDIVMPTDATPAPAAVTTPEAPKRTRNRPRKKRDQRPGHQNVRDKNESGENTARVAERRRKRRASPRKGSRNDKQ